jgi:hypothetical protein
MKMKRKIISCFSLFQVMEYRWNEIDRGKLKYLGKKNPVPVPLYPPQIPHRMTGIEPGPPRWEADD